MRRTSNSRSGFSILELLIALALMGLIAGGLASTMGLGARVWERSQTLQNNEVPAALRILLRNWVIQMTPPKRTLPFDHPFVGTPNRFSFTTLAELPSSPDVAALYIKVHTDINGLQMTIEYLDDGGSVKRSEERPLNDAEMIFSYYARGTDLWLTEWSDDRHLPDLVRIESKSVNPYWPEFTVAPAF